MKTITQRLVAHRSAHDINRCLLQTVGDFHTKTEKLLDDDLRDRAYLSSQDNDMLASKIMTVCLSKAKAGVVIELFKVLFAKTDDAETVKKMQVLAGAIESHRSDIDNFILEKCSNNHMLSEKDLNDIVEFLAGALEAAGARVEPGQGLNLSKFEKFSEISTSKEVAIAMAPVICTYDENQQVIQEKNKDFRELKKRLDVVDTLHGNVMCQLSEVLPSAFGYQSAVFLASQILGVEFENRRAHRLAKIIQAAGIVYLHEQHVDKFKALFNDMSFTNMVISEEQMLLVKSKTRTFIESLNQNTAQPGTRPQVQ